MPAFVNTVNFSLIPVQDFTFERRASDPGNSVEALAYWHTANKVLRVFDGSQWISVGGQGVQSVDATAPLLSTGGNSPTLSISPASGSSAGSMSSSHFTLVDGATTSSTGSTLVLRDSSGNFSAGTISANLTGTASNASNLNSEPGSFYLARANHTGTQSSNTISDFDTQVRISRLDQMSAPTSNLSVNNQRLINLADPTAPQDAVTRAYVDALITTGTNKGTARVATTESLALTSATATTITNTADLPTVVDGATLVEGDIVFVKDEVGTGATGASANGLYVYTAGTTWTRASNLDTSLEIQPGAFVFVSEGLLNGDNGYTLVTNAPISLGTTQLQFIQTSGAAQITAGGGLTKTGNQLDIGAGTGISVSADSVAIDTAVVVRKFAQNIGDGTSTSIPVTHNLGTRDVVWKVYTNSGSFEDVIPDCQRTGINVITLIFAVAPTANQYRIVIQA